MPEFPFKSLYVKLRIMTHKAFKNEFKKLFAYSTFIYIRKHYIMTKCNLIYTLTN